MKESLDGCKNLLFDYFKIHYEGKFGWIMINREWPKFVLVLVAEFVEFKFSNNFLNLHSIYIN